VLGQLAVTGQRGEDFLRWAPLIEELATCENLVGVKLGAIEEWRVHDPNPYLDWALRSFGFGRCMVEGNWFVSQALGARYTSSFEQVSDACLRLDATDDELRAVFQRNARRIYYSS
jgi:predicted TIM-barrel fold metal-dependent hydrolase